MSEKIHTAAYIVPLLTILILAGMAGCRSHRNIEQAPDTESGATTGKTYKHQPERFAANFDCTMSGSTVSGQMRMQQDSIIWASINKIIELGRMRLTPDSVYIYVKASNQLFKGTYEDVYRRTNYRTDFNTIQQAFLNAYRNRSKTVYFNIDARQFSGEMELKMKKYEAVAAQNYPMSIPKTVRPL